ncbi:MAG: serine/threonine-protein kinase, partial [Thermoanaerobaculia bacterium]
MTLSLRQLEGKYEVLHKIQEGGMGAVYKVRHLLLDQVRVVKVIRAQFANDESLQRRFRHEAKTAIRLRHTNLVELYDFVFDDADGTSFMVMEFIDGVTVEEVLARQGALPAGLVVEVARQCLDALAYLHGMGLLHRDVSPDNLMLTWGLGGRPRVKLIDLGIVKHVVATTGVTRTGSFVGKIRYASPEAFAGADVRPDERADLYSLGVVLYEALTGVHPIGGHGFNEIATAHMFKPPLPFEQSDPEGRVPLGLQRVVLKALEKAPDGRFADAEVMRAALLPFAAETAELERLFERALDAAAAPGSAPDAGPAAAAPGPAPLRPEIAVPLPAVAPA